MENKIAIKGCVDMLEMALHENDDDCFRSYFEQLCDIVPNSLREV